ncbi:hypothetical protein GVN16_09845 [Emticicia sp. CRIBPO]|uniref:sialate O-acetylesterase n=1 Tax=Emticicia sp. CRIBPO TaxID=2683258 RepID=UPI0014130BD5|nr:sialate O-acetylesterase [Emticicia sp. CRIBPO]NBA86064.1 hypothetical protein [Emticicia sp. CRIBPO]
MKNTLTILLIFFTITNVFSQCCDNIWTPRDNTVFQRSTTSSGTGGSTNVTFSGQIRSQVGAQYRIEKLDKYGNYVSDWKTVQAMPAGAVNSLGTSSGYFYFTLDVPTGWYKFHTYVSGVPQMWTKFGVGEVFIIAGQSNAQGFGDTQYISGLDDLDCVVGNRNMPFGGYGDLWTPSFTPINSSQPIIAPTGDRPWYYQSLGNKIVTRESGIVIPVAFYNVALSGTSIDNWYESLLRVRQMYSNNYANTLTYGTTVTTSNPWGFSTFDNRLPYSNMRDVLSYFANITGVRAVLWHQGEAETKTLLSIHRSSTYGAGPIPSGYSINDYDTKLNAIIADTRTLHSNLQWAISKASLIAATRISPSTLDLNIVNNSNNLVTPTGTTSIGNSVIQEQAAVQAASPSNISWLSENSDSFTPRTPDGIHFSEANLIQMANDTYSNMGTIFSKAPILPVIPPRLTLVKNSTKDYTVSTGSYNIYRWKNSYGGFAFEQDEPSMGNNYNPSPVGGDDGYSGYAKGSDGKIAQIVPWVFFTSVPGARVSAENQENEAQLESTSIFPNPVSTDRKLNIIFSTTMNTPMKLILMDQNGVILKKISDNISSGKHNYSILLDEIVLSTEIKFLYYRLETKQHNEVKRVVLTK